MKTPRHPFETGRSYSRDEVVSWCENYIRDGHVKAVPTKQALVRSMDQSTMLTFVWTPTNQSGWGASPMNPNCWRTPEGTEILPIQKNASPSRIRI
jgi:hypothetical protein